MPPTGSHQAGPHGAEGQPPVGAVHQPGLPTTSRSALLTRSAPRYRSRQGVVRLRPRHHRRSEPDRGGRLGTCPAGARAGPLSVAGLFLHLVVAERGPAHLASSCHRRGRQRAAGRATVKPPRLRQQRHRGALRRRHLTRARQTENHGIRTEPLLAVHRGDAGNCHRFRRQPNAG